MARYKPRGGHDVLTEAERLMLSVLLINPNIQAAASALRIKVGTAENRIGLIREKLSVRTTDEALAIWRERQAKVAA